MARLNVVCDSDEFPDIDAILHAPPGKAPPAPKEKIGKVHENLVLLGPRTSKRTIENHATQQDAHEISKSAPKVSCNEKRISRQQPLGTVQVNSLLLPKTTRSPEKPEHHKTSRSTEESDDARPVRSSPRKAAKRFVDYRVFDPPVSNSSASEFESYDGDLSDFIVHDSVSESEATPAKPPRRDPRSLQRLRRFVFNDSASDEEELPLGKPMNGTQRPLKKSILGEKPLLPFPSHSSAIKNPQPQVIDLTSSTKVVSSIACPDSMPKIRSNSINPGSDTDQNQDAAPAMLQ